MATPITTPADALSQYRQVPDWLLIQDPSGTNAGLYVRASYRGKTYLKSRLKSSPATIASTRSITIRPILWPEHNADGEYLGSFSITNCTFRYSQLWLRLVGAGLQDGRLTYAFSAVGGNTPANKVAGIILTYDNGLVSPVVMGGSTSTITNTFFYQIKWRPWAGSGARYTFCHGARKEQIVMKETES